MKTTYALVYQSGIANVFRLDDGRRTRVLQHSFGPCEWYARGLREAGKQVVLAWCNRAGDITHADWRYDSFEDAPFCESFTLLGGAR